MDPEKGPAYFKPKTSDSKQDPHQSSEKDASPQGQGHPVAPQSSNDALDPNNLNMSAFAGRLGAGQRFTLAPTKVSLEKETPDAYRNASWQAILSMRSIVNPLLWKLAIIEGFGTALQTIMTAYLGVGLVPSATQTSVGPIFPVAMATLGQVFIIALFVWALAPLTGGHLNPLITLGTFGGRLCSLPRTILYIIFQCIGAIIGGWVVRASLGTGAKGVEVIPGCFADPSAITPGEA